MFWRRFNHVVLTSCAEWAVALLLAFRFSISLASGFAFSLLKIKLWKKNQDEKYTYNFENYQFAKVLFAKVCQKARSGKFMFAKVYVCESFYA